MENEILIQSLIFIYGLFIGSFLNVLADRLPKGENVISDRSHCGKCKKNLRWWELVPVFSFIFLKGKCARCKVPLSVNYPLTELLTALMLTGLWQVSGGDIILFVLQAIIGACLFVIFFADLRYQIVPDSMVAFGTLAAAGLWIYQGGLINALTVPLFSGLGAAAFFLILFLITRGRGMGFGDVKLAIFLGMLVGFPGIVVALYAAFLTGAAVGVILVVTGKKKLKSQVPFGPFLIGGTVFALIWGPQVLELWKGVI